MSPTTHLPPPLPTSVLIVDPSQIEVNVQTKKPGLLTGRLSSFALLAKKRKFSESSIETAIAYDSGEDEETPPSTSIRRPLTDEREKIMRDLRELFAHGNIQSDFIQMPDKRWMQIRACMELFPVSGGCCRPEMILILQRLSSSVHIVASSF